LNKFLQTEKIFQKMLDKQFSVVLQLSTVRRKANEIFQEIIFVIQSWIHTNGTPNGSPALSEMRFSVSLSVCLCAGFDNPNYQTKLGGLDRAEKKI